MTTIKRNDKDGWKKGAGPFSRSYAKLSDTPPPGFAGHYPKAVGPGASVYNNRGAAPRVQDLIKGKDISRRADSAANANGGFAAEVSRNRRGK